MAKCLPRFTHEPEGDIKLEDTVTLLRNMKMVQEEIIRKGPWTEQEDFKLVSYVALFGDKRWDFIAKVSGLKVAGDKRNRSGKSCRLRWVNYLHPGLKGGKLTPLEERLVLELHSKWGNRWSKIARKLPGRTDNEIKNYWRTHMRKKAQDQKKRASSPKSASSNCLSSASSSQLMEYFPSSEAGAENYFDTGGNKTDREQESGDQLEYSLDDIWKDIAIPDNEFLATVFDVQSEEACNFSCPPMASPSWEYYEYSSEPLWMMMMMEEEESEMVLPNAPSYDQFVSCFEFGDSLW